VSVEAVAVLDNAEKDAAGRNANDAPGGWSGITHYTAYGRNFIRNFPILRATAIR
jgi:hypothetical protein